MFTHSLCFGVRPATMLGIKIPAVADVAVSAW